MDMSKDFIDVCIHYDAEFVVVDPETGRSTYGYFQGSGKELLETLEFQEQFGHVYLDRLEDKLEA